VAERRARPTDAADLLELAQVMTDTSICGLGQAASWAIVDAHKRWPGMFA
jgi:NADH:ubiquinone oxidoreductase subunit F (NADH-binding)